MADLKLPLTSTYALFPSNLLLFISFLIRQKESPSLQVFYLNVISSVGEAESSSEAELRVT